LPSRSGPAPRKGNGIGPGPDADRDPVPRDGHPDHDLRQVIAGVLRLAEGTEPDLIRGLAVLFSGCAVVRQEAALVVAGDGFVGLLQLEVGAGGVEEQQVDLEVEEVSDLVEHPLLQVVGHLVEPVHRPVAGVVVGGRQALDMRVVCDPVRGGQLGRRSQGPVRNQ
jgi:hypothetical protein